MLTRTETTFFPSVEKDLCCFLNIGKSVELAHFMNPICASHQQVNEESVTKPDQSEFRT